MSEEIFNVVDQNDEVVGRDSRANIHRLGLLHRAVHVLVFNSKGEIFLQKRSAKKDCFPRAWDSSAAGHVDAGEAYDSCAVREVSEELGIGLDGAPQRLFKTEACPETGQEFVWVYGCRHEGPFQLHPEEIECGQWITPEALSAWIRDRPQDFASSLPLIWRQFCASDWPRHFSPVPRSESCSKDSSRPGVV